MSDARIKPLIILPKNQMSAEDIQRLNDNGLCVVEAEDPSLVRFAEPPPAMEYDVRERAALQLFRRLMQRTNASYTRTDIANFYCDFILNGSPLEPIRDVPQVKTNKPQSR